MMTHESNWTVMDIEEALADYDNQTLQVAFACNPKKWVLSRAVV